MRSKKLIHQYTGLELTTADVQSGQFKVQFNFHPNPNPTRCKDIFLKKYIATSKAAPRNVWGFSVIFHAGAGSQFLVHRIMFKLQAGPVQSSYWTSSKFNPDVRKFNPTNCSIQLNSIQSSIQANPAIHQQNAWGYSVNVTTLCAFELGLCPPT